MDIFPSKALIRIGSSLFERFFGRTGRDQTVAALADQIGAIDRSKRFADFEIILGFEELHQRALGFAIAKGFCNVDGFEIERIQSRVVHAGGYVERRWDEVLDLIRFVSISF